MESTNVPQCLAQGTWELTHPSSNDGFERLGFQGAPSTLPVSHGVSTAGLFPVSKLVTESDDGEKEDLW